MLLTSMEVIVLFGLSYINLGLVFDARYRDFPTMFLVLPVVALLISKINFTAGNAIGSRIHPVYALLFSFWMLISSIIIACIERLTNYQAIGWCICCLLLAWSLLPRLRNAQTLQAHANV